MQLAAVSSLPPTTPTPLGTLDTPFSVLPTFTGSPFSPVVIPDALNRLGQTWLSWLFFVISIGAIVYVLWAGINLITSGGDIKKAEQARKALVSGVIGIILVASTYLFIRIGQSIAEFVLTRSKTGNSDLYLTTPKSSPTPTLKSSPTPKTSPTPTVTPFSQST